MAYKVNLWRNEVIEEIREILDFLQIVFSDDGNQGPQWDSQEIHDFGDILLKMNLYSLLQMSEFWASKYSQFFLVSNWYQVWSTGSTVYSYPTVCIRFTNIFLREEQIFNCNFLHELANILNHPSGY